MRFLLSLVCVLAAALPASVPAAGSEQDQTQAKPNAQDPAPERIRTRLAQVRPGLEVLAVEPSPMPGLYVVDVNGGTLYVSADARFLLPGKLYGLSATDLVDLDADRLAARRKAMMSTVALKDMIVFRPPGDVKAVVNVFTDVDCGYCRKLHQEVPELNALGIEVRYLAYPRAGVGSDSFNKIVSAWCANDRQSSLTTLKAGGAVPNRSCANPVADQFLLGQRVGVTGTPSLITDEGVMFPGYMPAQQLAERLGI